MQTPFDDEYDDGPPTLISDETLVRMDEEETTFIPPVPAETRAGDTARIPRVETDETTVIPPVPAVPQAPSPEPGPAETALDPETVHRRRHRAYQEQVRPRQAPSPFAVRGVTREVPPLPGDDSIRGELFRDEMPPPRSHRRPARFSMPTIRLPQRPGSLESWKQTAREMARDPNSILGLIIIFSVAALTMWGTMVAFAPDWVPPVVNPRADKPGRTGSPLIPPALQGDPAPAPRRPLQSSQGPVPGRSKAPGAPGAPAPSQSPSQGPSGTPSGSPTDGAPQPPLPSPTGGTQGPGTGSPTDPGTQGPGSPSQSPPPSSQEPQEPTPPQSPSGSPPGSPSAPATRTQTATSEPSQSASASSEPSPSDPVTPSSSSS